MIWFELKDKLDELKVYNSTFVRAMDEKFCNLGDVTDKYNFNSEYFFSV